LSDITVNTGLYSHDIKAEIIADYEKNILPQKIKEATDKLHKQWQHALSKSNRRLKAISSRDKWWIEQTEVMFEEALDKMCSDERCNVAIETEDCNKKICVFYQWQFLKKSLERK